MRPIPSSVYNKEYYQGMGGKEFFRSKKYTGSKYEKIANLASNYCDLRGAFVLDYGCGRGDMLYFLARTIKEGLGVDYSQAAINIAKRHCLGKTNLKFFLQESSHLPKSYVNKYDIVFLLDVIEHLTPDQLKNTLRNLRQCLKKEGILIVHTFPNKIMNALAHMVCRMQGRISSGMMVHINCQTRTDLVNLLIEQDYQVVWSDIETQKDLFKNSLIFRDNIFDRIYNNDILARIIKMIPLFNEIYFSDIFVVAKKNEPSHSNEGYEN